MMSMVATAAEINNVLIAKDTGRAHFCSSIIPSGWIGKGDRGSQCTLVLHRLGDYFAPFTSENQTDPSRNYMP